MRLFKLILRKHILDYYSSKSILVGGFLGIILELSVYWFTAKAFGSAVQDSLGAYGGDYFKFIVMGETVLAVPLALFQGLSRSLQTSASEGTFDFYILSRPSPFSIFVQLGSGYALRAALHASIVLFIAAIIYDLRLSLLSMAIILGFQIISIPLFVGLGSLAASATIYFGRGLGVISHISNLALIFAGAYFPLSVLPQGLREAISLGSPFALILESTRRLVSDGPTPVLELKLLMIWTLLSVPLGYFAFKKSLDYHRKRGSPLLFSP